MLRPHLEIEDVRLAYENDDDGYFGAFRGEEMVGVAIVQPEARKGSTAEAPWRLRGMAVLPEHRHLGVGRRLVEAALDHVQTRGGDEVWCHGRVPALGFYCELGFHTEGDEFTKPPTGSYFIVVRSIPPAG